MIYKTFEKLNDPEYRRAFVASQINIGIPFQIRALLKSRPGWTQATLAQRAGMLQPRISGLMTPGKVRPNIETLRRIAEAFDCGLIVRFAPFSELARWSEDFDPESFYVPSFNDDPGFIERKQQARAARGFEKEPEPPTDWFGQEQDFWMRRVEEGNKGTLNNVYNIDAYRPRPVPDDTQLGDQKGFLEIARGKENVG